MTVRIVNVEMGVVLEGYGEGTDPAAVSGALAARLADMGLPCTHARGILD